ncbi:tetratricopeptide repeat protein [Bacteroides sp.]|uniref:tetratricopeptide repeat protein n=1 Tax=Bacteroides sp. TaxID=29523 RepID=UPI003AB20140
MEQLTTIKELINQGNIEQAIRLLDEILQTADFPGKDEAYYLRGNAYRKQGDWQQALNNYQYAIDLNPESPALHAQRMAMDILNFYNKDMYNQ